MRLFVSIIASAAMFFVASMASAQAVYTATGSAASGNALDSLVVGDVVTVDITLRTTDAVQGLGASASGYDGVLAFDSGQATASVLFEQCFPSFGCFNGASNLVGGDLIQTSLSAGTEVQFVTVALGAPTANTGAVDPGLDGVSGNPQFRIVFNAIAPGQISLTLGSLTAFGDGTILAGGAVGTTSNTVLDITVIPEPGTALLMGLGLAGLAAAGRRE